MFATGVAKSGISGIYVCVISLKPSVIDFSSSKTYKSLPIMTIYDKIKNVTIYNRCGIKVAKMAFLFVLLA